jgi:hypothetical protein
LFSTHKKNPSELHREISIQRYTLRPENDYIFSICTQTLISIEVIGISVVFIIESYPVMRCGTVPGIHLAMFSIPAENIFDLDNRFYSATISQSDNAL